MSEESNNTVDAGTGDRAEVAAASMAQTFLAVMFQPAGFFAAMSRRGGYVQPLLFMVVMGVAAGVVRAVLGLVGLAGGVSTAMSLAAIVITPILIAVFGFVVAAVLFVIWKIMGSEQDFETAYRCTAYGSAISPVTQVLAAIPYVGLILNLAWWTLILVVASVQVHRIGRTNAVVVFGIIAVIFAVIGVGSELAARRMAGALDQAQHKFDYDQGNRQDAGKAMQQLGTMLQNMGKAAQQHPQSGQ